MSPTLHQLRVFMSVADTTSFTRSARELHLSQPVVSRTVRDLEAVVGGELFRRTTRSVDLTPAGHELHRVAADILAAYDRGFARFDGFRNGTAGTVVLAALPSIAASLLPSTITTFRDRFPEVEVRVRDGTSSEVDALLRRGEADVAIADAVGAGPELESAALADDRMVAVVPPAHALARQRTITWAQLANDHFVTLQLGTSIRRLTDQAFHQAGHMPRSVLETGAVSTAGAIVAAGLGVTAVPELALPLLAFADVVQRPLGEPVVTRRLTLLTRSGSDLSAPARRLRDHLLAAVATGTDASWLGTGVLPKLR
jgi:LysR family carnitine catabolism transcriptional activator